jgi:hypothetical protein
MSILVNKHGRVITSSVIPAQAGTQAGPVLASEAVMFVTGLR